MGISKPSQAWAKHQKDMAVLYFYWHTDYNSCATHTPAPNPGGVITESNIYGGNINTSLFWSWPAQ
ncbi:hypothetical protein, partial [Shewanella algae]|uniref:hypothetical protein n=1 Tax=Shewanella algae TaxID=38313 RepID=UPI001AAC92D3